jgi:hypothetical protein
MGFFAETKVIDRASVAVRREGGGGEIDALRSAAAEFESSIRPFVGTAGGFMTTEKPVMITFPLLAPVRPLSATRDLARRMGVGVGE